MVESFVSEVGIVHHFLIIYHFKHMLARKQSLHHANKQNHRHHIVVFPHGRLDIWLGVLTHTNEAQGKGNQHGACHQSELARMPPVEPVAIVEQPRHL